MRAILSIPAVGLAAAAVPDVGDATTPGQSRHRSGFRRPSVIKRGSALASSVLAAVLFAGCTGEGVTTASAGNGSPSSTSVEPSASTTSEPADPTGDETGGQGSGNNGSGGQG